MCLEQNIHVLTILESTNTDSFYFEIEKLFTLKEKGFSSCYYWEEKQSLEKLE